MIKRLIVAVIIFGICVIGRLIDRYKVSLCC